MIARIGHNTYRLKDLATGEQKGIANADKQSSYHGLESLRRITWGVGVICEGTGPTPGGVESQARDGRQPCAAVR